MPVKPGRDPVKRLGPGAATDGDMLQHWKLALTAALTGLLLWTLRTGPTPNALYPIIPPAAKHDAPPRPAGPGTTVTGRVT